MTMTQHGMLRMKERCGVGKSHRKIERLATKALEKGTGYEDAKGSIKCYMKSKRASYGKSYDMRAFGGCMYIFQDDKMITMYPIPGKYFVKAKTA